MDKRKYQNKNDYWEVLGSIITKPSLLDDYNIVADDFVESFHRDLYLTAEEMYHNGYKSLDAYDISKYMEQYYPVRYAMYKKCNGDAYVSQCGAAASVANIDVHYESLKKWSLLRQYAMAGIDISHFYDPDEIDVDVIEAQSDALNSASPRDITDYFIDKITTISDNVRVQTNRLPIYDPMDLPDADEDEDVIVEGMMYAHTLNNITGQSKAGKSFLGFQLAYCVQNGIDFLDHKTNKTDVLYIDFELRPKSIKDRCAKLQEHYGLVEPENFKVMSLGNTWGNGTITLDSIVQSVKKYKLQNPNLGLVVFDPFYRFAIGEENKAEDVMQTLTKLKSLTKDMTVLYVHHTNKMGAGNNPINAGSGSGVHGRAVDQTYVLTAKKDGYEIINTGRDWYNDKMICTRDDTGYFDLETAEMQAQKEEEKRHTLGGKLVVTKEQLKDKYPELCKYIDDNTDDDYGCALSKIIKAYPNESAKSLKDKGFKYTGKNKRSDSIPSGRILYP